MTVAVWSPHKLYIWSLGMRRLFNKIVFYKHHLTYIIICINADIQSSKNHFIRYRKFFSKLWESFEKPGTVLFFNLRWFSCPFHKKKVSENFHLSSSFQYSEVKGQLFVVHVICFFEEVSLCEELPYEMRKL